MNLYRTTKTVLKISPHPQSFLNGLTTNSLDKPHNAFVNVQGRIIATFDQVCVSEENYLLVVETDFVPGVLSHLERFAILSKIRIQPENFQVYFDLDGNYVPGDQEWVVLQKRGQLIITSQNLSPNVSEEEFTLFRLRNNMPLLGCDYHQEMILNVSETDFVSFTKGCFLGQEPIAKVHHRSRPTWKLVVKSEDECSSEEKAKMTSRTFDVGAGEIKGFVFVSNH